MTLLAAAISLIYAFIALIDWRRGLLAVIVIGVLQDAFRKLTPGAPAFYILWSMAFYLGVIAFATFSRSLPALSTIYMQDRTVKTAWRVFIGLVLLQMLNALVRWGSPLVPIFGAVFYFGPVLAMLAASGFASSEKRLRQYLRFYVLVLVPACLTVFLSPSLADSWPVLRDVGTFTGEELIIYDFGAALKSYSGILRSGEISSWHAATAAMFISTLSITARGKSHRLLSAVLVALLIGVIMLTGRRKMLMALSIFFLVQWALLAWFKKGMGKVAIMVILVGTISSFSFTLLEPSSQTGLYIQRSSTVFGDATERMNLAFELMRSAFNRSSGIGLGAGAAAQGGRYAGIDQSKMVGGAAESGLGMLMVELGIPGLLAVIGLLIVVTRRMFMRLRQLSTSNSRFFQYQICFLSFLFANLMTFTVATQIYGDFFVLIILGTVAGFALRLSNVAAQTPIAIASTSLMASAVASKRMVDKIAHSPRRS